MRQWSELTIGKAEETVYIEVGDRSFIGVN